MKARKLALLLGFGLCFSASTLFAEMYKENVVASFYADKFNGRRTASGEIFDTNGYTAAHKTLPFGTVLKVTNLDNGKSVKVRINDRGPFVQGREIDVSKAAALELDMVSNGTAKVSLEIVDGTEGPVASKTSSSKSSSSSSKSSSSSSSKSSSSSNTSSSSSKTTASQASSAPAPVSSNYDDEDEEEDEDVYYTSYDDEDEDDDDYSTADSGSSGSGNTGFSFGGASPFSSGLSSSGSSSYYADDEYADDEEEEEEEEDDEPLPPPPPPKKETVSKKEPAPKAESAGAVKKETKTVTTTTTTTTTVVEEEPSAKRWDIQLGAYTNEGNAKVMAHRLLQAGFDNVAYQKVGSIIRVVLRDIDEADLDKFQSKLDETGFSSYIVRERKNIIKKD